MLATATTFSGLSFQKKTLWLSFMFLVIATPFSMIWGKPIAKHTDNMSCLAQHELSFMNFATLKFTTYNDECGEAQAVMSIAKMGSAINPPDNGMIATSLTVWRHKYPKMEAAMAEITAELVKAPRVMQAPLESGK